MALHRSGSIGDSGSGTVVVRRGNGNEPGGLKSHFHRGVSDTILRKLTLR